MIGDIANVEVNKDVMVWRLLYHPEPCFVTLRGLRGRGLANCYRRLDELPGFCALFFAFHFTLSSQHTSSLPLSYVEQDGKPISLITCHCKLRKVRESGTR